MSLLLDALKRAEQEKLARQPGAPPPHEPAAPRVASAASLELQPIAGGGTPPQGMSHRGDPAMHSAQNVFHAKAANAPGEARRNRTMLWVTFGAIGVVAVAAAAYVWYSVQALTPQYSAMPRMRPAPTPPPASSAPLPPVTTMGSIGLAPGNGPGIAPATNGPAAAQPASAPPAAEPAPAAAPPATPADRIVRDASGFRNPPPLQLERTPTPPRSVPAGVASGYEALRMGDLAAARRGYESALAADPANVDAHLGMATIAARQGNRAMAAEHYRRTLDLDPRNATALAGLALLADAARPEALETQLRAEVLRSPESPALLFALGNLYASQGRWTEAQASYFEAHRLDPGSPDVAHNLAVSLDRLGQGRLAAGFYRRALEAAGSRSAQFDAAAVARRLEELR